MKQSWQSYSKRAPIPARTGPDGFVYDSKTEMLRGIDLQLLQRAGEIKALERQKSLPLSYHCGCRSITIMAGQKPAIYTPDFVYWCRVDSGHAKSLPPWKNKQLSPCGQWFYVIEDVKGYADENSKLRIRVFEALHGAKVVIGRKIKAKGWVFL